MTRHGPVAVALVLIGGLLLAGAGTGAWVSEAITRSVGGVELAETRTTSGLELAPLAVPLGVAAALGSVPLAVARGPARRLLGILAAIAGLGALAVVGVGVLRAAGFDGGLTAAPGAAALGAVLILAGGLLAAWATRPRPALGPRFDLDAERADDEWTLASEDQA